MMRILYLYEGSFVMYRRRLEGVYRAASAEGWCVDAVNVDVAEAGINEVLECWQADGLVVEGGLMNRPDAAVIRKTKTPHVISDIDESNMDEPYFGVIYDSSDTVSKAWRELSRNGYGNFAFVNFRIKRDWSILRERQFRECHHRRQPSTKQRSA